MVSTCNENITSIIFFLGGLFMLWYCELKSTKNNKETLIIWQLELVKKVMLKSSSFLRLSVTRRFSSIKSDCFGSYYENTFYVFRHRIWLPKKSHVQTQTNNKLSCLSRRTSSETPHKSIVP